MTLRGYHGQEKANIGGERNCHSFRGLRRGGSIPSPLSCLANHYQHIMDVAARHRVQFQMPETDAVAMLKNL